MNILVTIDRNYLHQLRVMLFSLKESNPQSCFTVYVVHRTLTAEDLEELYWVLADERMTFVPIRPDYEYRRAVVTDRYPVEMYDRLLAPSYLPETVDRVLYLDPDIIVKGDVTPLYELDFGGKLFAGATHIQNGLLRFNELRLGVKDCDLYVNTGVLLIHVEALRKEQDEAQVLSEIEHCRKPLLLPDQDIITMLYGDRIRAVDALRYNLSDRLLMLGRAGFLSGGAIDRDWPEREAVILHFCGRNKPWKEGYKGLLGAYYCRCEDRLRRAEEAEGAREAEG